MKVVGLTGGIGSGKTTVLRMFHDLGIHYYIADIEAKKLMQTSKIIHKKLRKNFGEEVYQKNILNRPYLANIVFKNPKKLAILNNIVHPEVHTHFENFLKEQKGSYIIYENAILFESKAANFCDKIITVTAPINERIYRVMQRDTVTKRQVEDRIHNQLTDSVKIEKSDYVIVNITMEETKEQVAAIHLQLLESLKKC